MSVLREFSATSKKTIHNSIWTIIAVNKFRIECIQLPSPIVWKILSNIHYKAISVKWFKADFNRVHESIYL